MSERERPEGPFDYVRVLSGSVDQAVDRLTRELTARGFGVLATFAVHQLLEQKLGAHIPPVVILEVCSPRLAAAALGVNRRVAPLLPCTVVAAEESDGTHLALQRPTVVLGRLLPEPGLEDLGREVEASLRAAVDAAADSVRADAGIGAGPRPPRG